MHICHFWAPGQGARIGWRQQDRVIDLTASGAAAWATFSTLLQASQTMSIHELVAQVHSDGLPQYAWQDLDRTPDEQAAYLLPPVDQQEVWAAGVTYAWSREARVREAVAKDVYVRVYEAERPELFFKSTANKAVGPHDWVGIRGDSQWNVPEPELVLVLNPAMQIVGYTIGNDVSSRDIEGENPLYLPQAKFYTHACALGPVITLAEEAVDARKLVISMRIVRAGAEVFSGETNTSQMAREPQELANWLGRFNAFPHGALLLTGTGIVPDDTFTLQDGDEVAITIEGIGVLRNVVRRL